MWNQTTTEKTTGWEFPTVWLTAALQKQRMCTESGEQERKGERGGGVEPEEQEVSERTRGEKYKDRKKAEDENKVENISIRNKETKNKRGTKLE